MQFGLPVSHKLEKELRFFTNIFSMPPIIFEHVLCFLCSQALGEKAASGRGFFRPESCIPGFFEDGNYQNSKFFSKGGVSKRLSDRIDCAGYPIVYEMDAFDDKIGPAVKQICPTLG